MDINQGEIFTTFQNTRQKLKIIDRARDKKKMGGSFCSARFMYAR
jgi:hypothetical protein